MSGRQYATQRDSYRRKVEKEKLDGYGWVMSLDTVRTPEEILLIKHRFARLERHIDKLSPRIGRVLRLRLGINCRPHTFEEIARAIRRHARAYPSDGSQGCAHHQALGLDRGEARGVSSAVRNQAKVYKERMEAEREAEQGRASRVALRAGRLGSAA